MTVLNASQPILAPQDTTFAALVQADYSLRLSQVPQPHLPKGGALIQMTACGLCGSDLDKLMNQKAATGSVLGHEVVGVIQQLDDAHKTPFSVGDRIVSSHHVPCGTCHYCINQSESMCRTFKTTNLAPGGFSEQFALTANHLKHTTFKVPRHISDDEATCIEPLACVLKAVRRGGEFKNGSVAVIGMGFIGMMASQIYQSKGYSVYGMDLDRERLTFAETQGFVQSAFHPLEDKEGLQQALAAQTQTGRLDQVDLVFLTVVTPKTLELALELVRDSGTLIIFSSALTPDTMIHPSVLYFREIRLIPSYSPNLQDLKAAADLIFNQSLQVGPLCTHHRPLEKAMEAVELYQGGQALKVIITPRSSS